MFYNYIFESRLFYRYLNEGILQDLMRSAAEIMVDDEGCYEFLASYIRALTDAKTIADLIDSLVLFVDQHHRTPAICSIFNELYLKADGVSLVKLNYIFLPIVSDLLISLKTTQLISTFVAKADELTLISLVDILCCHLLHHLVLQQ